VHPRQLLAATTLALVLSLARAGQPQPLVVRVQPSAGEVPANLLRFSIEFAAPVEGPVLPRIGLAHVGGMPLREPFLQQELWSPDGRILTVLLHPGRVKTGLIAHEKLGPILREGEDVVLIFDKLLLKRWHVGPEDADGPVASAWRLSPVRAASRQPLVVTLDAAIDGRDADELVVVDAHDRLVDGWAKLGDGETTWTFEPARSWQAGAYRLAVHATLEDPAGNRLNGHFETPMGTIRKQASDVFVDFHVGSPTPPETTSSLQPAR
jgi:hypothetical protein